MLSVSSDLDRLILDHDLRSLWMISDLWIRSLFTRDLWLWSLITFSVILIYTVNKRSDSIHSPNYYAYTSKNYSGIISNTILEHCIIPPCRHLLNGCLVLVVWLLHSEEIGFQMKFSSAQYFCISWIRCDLWSWITC